MIFLYLLAVLLSIICKSLGLESAFFPRIIGNVWDLWCLWLSWLEVECILKLKGTIKKTETKNKLACLYRIFPCQNFLQYFSKAKLNKFTQIFSEKQRWRRKSMRWTEQTDVLWFLEYTGDKTLIEHWKKSISLNSWLMFRKLPLGEEKLRWVLLTQNTREIYPTYERTNTASTRGKKWWQPDNDSKNMRVHMSVVF